VVKKLLPLIGSALAPKNASGTGTRGTAYSTGSARSKTIKDAGRDASSISGNGETLASMADLTCFRLYN
jgi:hypothetical protein